MKMLRSCAMALGLALASALSGACSVMSAVVKPLVRYLAVGVERLASGVDKLHRELAQKFSESAEPAMGVSSGLSREGHGYRQASAMKQLFGLAPAGI